MKKKAVFSVILMVLFLTMAVGPVLAGGGGRAPPISINVNQIIQKLVSWYNHPVTLPAIGASPSGTYSAGHLIMVYFLAFAIIYLAAVQFVPLFKDSNRPGATMVVAGTIAAIAVFGTPFVDWVLYFMYFFIGYGGLALFLVCLLMGGIMVLKVSRRVISHDIRDAGEDAISRGEGHQMKAEGARMTKDAKGAQREIKLEKKTEREEEAALKNLRSTLRKESRSIRDIQQQLKNLLKATRKLSRIRDAGEAGQEKERIVRELGRTINSVASHRRLEERRAASLNIVNGLAFNILQHVQNAGHVRALIDGHLAANPAHPVNNAGAGPTPAQNRNLDRACDIIFDNVRSRQQLLNNLASMQNRTENYQEAVVQGVQTARDQLRQGGPDGIDAAVDAMSSAYEAIRAERTLIAEVTANERNAERLARRWVDNVANDGIITRMAANGRP
jgi:hypothetical protein